MEDKWRGNKEMRMRNKKRIDRTKASRSHTITRFSLVVSPVCLETIKGNHMTIYINFLTNRSTKRNETNRTDPKLDAVV